MFCFISLDQKIINRQCLTPFSFLVRPNLVDLC